MITMISLVEAVNLINSEFKIHKKEFKVVLSEIDNKIIVVGPENEEKERIQRTMDKMILRETTKIGKLLYDK